MKKTLFLSAILGAALCSSAFADATSLSSITAGSITIDGDTFTQITAVNDFASLSEGNDATFLKGNGRYSVTNATNFSNAGTIVVASANLSGAEEATSAGQLWVNGWDSSSGISITNDLVIGATGYDESGDTYDTALRLHESRSNKKIVLSGSVQLAQDSKIAVNHEYNYIEGNISGTGKTLTLTDGGGSAQLHLSGGATLNSLSAGDVLVTMDATKSDGTTAAASKSYTINTMTVKELQMAAGTTLTLNGAFTGKLVMAEGASLNNTTTANNTWVRLKSGSSVRTLNVRDLDFERNNAFTVDMYGTNIVRDQLDLAGSADVKAGLNLKENATLSTGRIWLNTSSRGVTLENNASLTFGNITIKGLSSEEGSLGSLVRVTNTGGNAYGIGDASAKISNAEVTLLANNLTLGNQLSGVTLDGTDKNVTLSGTISGASVISNATLSGKIEGGTISHSTLSGQIAGGTITDSVYRGNNMTGGTLNNVELAFNERLNIHGGGHVTLGNVTNRITASTYNYGIVVYDANTSVTVNGTTDLVTYANGRDKIGLGDGNTLTVQEGGHLISGALYTSENSLNGEFTVEAGGQMDVKGKTHIKTLSNAGTTTIQNALNAATITNSGTLTAASLAAADNNHAGNRADVTNSGTLNVTGNAAINTLTITSGSVTLGSATSGINTVVNSGSLSISADAATITDLTLNSDAVVQLQDNHSGTLTTSSLTVNGDSTMNANLVMGSGSTLTFAEGAVLTMGCDVTISGSTVYVTIDGTFDAFMADLRAGNSTLVLIDGLESADEAKALTLGGLYVTDSTGNTFTNSELGLKVVENTYTSNGAYAIVVAPEPATATLSLLALAALASRRRRH